MIIQFNLTANIENCAPGLSSALKTRYYTYHVMAEHTRNFFLYANK